MNHYDVAIIGGGVVGLSTACGITRDGTTKVVVVSAGDEAFSGSRSNFGLVWYQGKGDGAQHYVRFVRQAIHEWRGFSDELVRTTGIDLGYHQCGGLKLCLGEEATAARVARISRIADQCSPDEPYECEILDRSQLKEIFGSLRLGDEVHSASYSPLDGHVNPLFLLKALHKQFLLSGGRFFGGQHVEKISVSKAGTFELHTSARNITADRVLLAAGLDNARLGENLGIRIPVVPDRGHILVTQRTRRLFPVAMNGFRQTDEGSVLIGSSTERVGFNDSVDTNIAAMIANQAIRAFPELAELRLQRTWAGLRTHSPDKLPVYAESPAYPGAFAVMSHSGITLAAIHSRILPDWIMKGNTSEDMRQFSVERFSV
ncbi:MAG: NAD(P)/FAD-dependent oxidoreductase [Steroidobacteraceae bacterium]